MLISIMGVFFMIDTHFQQVKNMSRDQAHIFGDTKENCHPFYEGGNGAVFIPNCIENLKFSKQE
uniref:Uncharacterized protein n=1 Tax=Physcomitrium patens TaxID=3218 RepID=A0A2K1JIR6_PHYPA|nr:hypothetical protein PHYPA_018822 [Physcomitrium patens]